METHVKEIGSDYQKLLSNVNKTVIHLSQLRNNLDEMEQYSRRDCHEIRGIPLKEDEDTYDIVQAVADLVDVQIDQDDVSISHRLPIKNHGNESQNRDPAIIVKFIQRDLCDELY